VRFTRARVGLGNIGEFGNGSRGLKGLALPELLLSNDACYE
jgi:hypothetical protein